MVWLSAKRLVEEGRVVYLASRDRAFQGDSGVLRRELEAEVCQLPGALELVTNLRSWVVDRASSVAPQMADREAGARREVLFYGTYLGPWGYEDVSLDPASARLPIEAGDAKLSDVYEYGDLQTVLTRALPGGETYVEFEQPLRVHLEGLVPAAHVQAQDWNHVGSPLPGMVAANWDTSVIARFGVTFAFANAELHGDDDETGFAVEYVRFRHVE